MAKETMSVAQYQNMCLDDTELRSKPFTLLSADRGGQATGKWMDIHFDLIELEGSTGFVRVSQLDEMGTVVQLEDEE